jgi:hypothetical protein
VRHAESSDSHGTIDFGWGRCVLRATDDALVLRAEADDEEHLRRMEQGVAARVEKIGRRDGLTVTWRRIDAPAPEPAAQPGPAEAAAQPAPAAADVVADAPHGSASRRRGLGRTIALVAIAAVVIAVHLGLAGAVSKGSAWTLWGLGAVLLIVLAKLALIGGHGVLRSRGLRVFPHRRRHPAATASSGAEGPA